MKKIITLSLVLMSMRTMPASAQILSPLTVEEENDSVLLANEDKEWEPTGAWPFLNRRFRTAEVVTGFFNKKRTIVPCNIHIGNQCLYYVKKDTLMQADPSNVGLVTFRNGDRYMAIGGKNFAKIVHEDAFGKILKVRTVDIEQHKRNGQDVSSLGAVTIQGDFGSLSLNLIGSYVGNPEERPLPVLDTFYFIYDMDIFEVTDKNVMKHIDKSRQREYKNFTRSAEIIMHNFSSVKKIWDTFFVVAPPKKL